MPIKRVEEVLAAQKTRAPAEREAALAAWEEAINEALGRTGLPAKVGPLRMPTPQDARDEITRRCTDAGYAASWKSGALVLTNPAAPPPAGWMQPRSRLDDDEAEDAAADGGWPWG